VHGHFPPWIIIETDCITSPQAAGTATPASIFIDRNHACRPVNAKRRDRQGAELPQGGQRRIWMGYLPDGVALAPVLRKA
jgi:hypothetical protein